MQEEEAGGGLENLCGNRRVKTESRATFTISIVSVTAGSGNVSYVTGVKAVKSRWGGGGRFC